MIVILAARTVFKDNSTHVTQAIILERLAVLDDPFLEEN